MNLLLLSPALPNDFANGTALRAHHFARCLRERHRVEFVGGLGADCGEQQPLSFSGRLKRTASLSHAFGYSPETARRIRGMLQSDRWDVVVPFTAEMLQYLASYAGPVVPDLVDEPMLANFREARCHGLSVAGLRSCKRVLEMFVYEQRFFRGLKSYVVSSTADARWVRRAVNGSGVAVVPNGVDTEFFAPGGSSPMPGRIVFLGNMGFSPNIAAAKHFASDIFPAIRAARPRCTWTIVGANPSAEIRALRTHPGVTVTGWVSDVRPHLEHATVIVAPLISGGGIKNKILEAWAMRKPVVATPLGSAGVNAVPGKDILIARTAEEFASSVLRVMDDTSLAARLAEAGLRKAKSNYSWHAQSLLLERVLCAAASLPRMATV